MSDELNAGVVLGLILGLIIGISLGVLGVLISWENHAIDNGYGQYNTKTGGFEFKLESIKK